jgi:ribosome-binding protein aMBF1 (putative translation factor)
MSQEASVRDHDLPDDGRYQDEYQARDEHHHRPEYRSSPNAIGAGFLVLVARELTGTTQRRLAERVGTSQPTLARIETGTPTPTVGTLHLNEDDGLADFVVYREPSP